ncbi:amino acid adenylation domain-containing protein [Tunturibacter empetritectus]|uniref:Amino acid adenylation domain-containing protein n=1 Tax=Tunturiibacter lichenicola TaxID=2051959 RepID=A0A7W8N466_9BACT|nr:amino acid adenylation domain-containing protein [Edaphobacter lichenicola]MBB5343276.1 amino acid adenylation domain-containing protein [Edaphobacter lichenicola]
MDLRPQASEVPGSGFDGRALDTIVSVFERVAAAKSDQVAIVWGEVRWTYGLLNARANELARRLQELGVRTDSFVAIYLDRSPEMIVAILGILKAGGAYLPIDFGYPKTRVLEMLEDARPVAIVTTAALALGVSGELTALSVSVVEMEGGSVTPNTGTLKSATPNSSEPNNPSCVARAEDLAYLMYTSGSTGKPKGVMVTHRNVLRLLEQTDAWFHFGANDVWTMFHSIAFDFSVWEIWGPLLTGGRLVIVPFAVSRSPREFYELLSRERVTVLNQTPSAFFMLMQVEIQVEQDSAVLPLSLRVVIFGGEALQYRKLAPWFQRHGDTAPRLVNMYGITETTVHVTYRPISAGEAESVQESLIGVPIPDMQLYLLDEAKRPVQEGELGELYVGGGGVTRGYLNRPQLNAERFIDDCFGSVAGARLYRTGDLARIRPDGEMVYLGRNDSQVKINGFRIELGEVEAALAETPGVKQSCVVALTDKTGTQRLAAYFVAAPGIEVTARMLGEFFVSKMPAQMRPSSYTALKELPLTVNGKLDVAALPAPSVGSAGVIEAGSNSQSLSETEERVSRVFTDVLDLQGIGLDDNFFDSGGTSLLLISAHLRLQAQFERLIPITVMFECPTVRSLAKRLSTNGTSASEKDAIQQQAQKARGAFARARATKGVAS